MASSLQRPCHGRPFAGHVCPGKSSASSAANGAAQRFLVLAASSRVCLSVFAFRAWFWLRLWVLVIFGLRSAALPNSARLINLINLPTGDPPLPPPTYLYHGSPLSIPQLFRTSRIRHIPLRSRDRLRKDSSPPTTANSAWDVSRRSSLAPSPLTALELKRPANRELKLPENSKFVAGASHRHLRRLVRNTRDIAHHERPSILPCKIPHP